MENQQYRCLKCGWVGTEDQMFADSMASDEDEIWSNWICPRCQTWWLLKDYEEVEPVAKLGTAPAS